MNCNGLRDNFNLVDKVNCYIQNNHSDFETNRKVIRNNIVDLFKEEKAGSGTGNNSTRTIYCVEKISDEIIFLKRPAVLNNGFDFEIHTKTKQFGSRIKTMPRHKDIIELLKQLKVDDLKIFQKTKEIINEIYHCNEENICTIKYKINNIEIETILKLIKWLFLEQDVTYWHFSGRKMFYDGLANV